MLDEADLMLDMGFITDVKKIEKLCPAKKQTLLFSATMTDNIIGLAKLMQKKSRDKLGISYYFNLQIRNVKQNQY